MISYLDKIGLEYFWGKIKSKLSTKVDKVDGKGLSTNDYTTAEKNKLAGIAEGAEVNVLPDWNATSGDAVILNKPNIKVDSISSEGVNIGNNKIITRGLYVSISDSKNSIELDSAGDTGIRITANDGTDGTITLSASSRVDINTTGTNKAYYNNKEIATVDDIPTHYAGSATTGGTANKTASIPYAQVDSTSTSTAFTATVDGITELRDGVCCLLKNGRVTSASGFTLNVNNLGAKPCYTNLAAATRDTTIFNINYTMLFVYDSTRVDGGGWICYRGYDNNSDVIGYDVREYYSASKKLKTAMQRYQLVMTTMDDMLLPVYSGAYTTATTKVLTTESFNPFGQIYYYGTTTNIAANGGVAAGLLYLLAAYTLVPLYYSFNTGSTLTAGDDIYLVCVPLNDGSVKLHSSPVAKSLPTTEDGLVYKRLGKAHDTYRIILELDKPCYYYKNGAVRPWTNGISDELEKKVNDNSLIVSAALTDLNDRINDMRETIDTNTIEILDLT